MKANVMSAVKKILILLSNCWCLYMYMFRLNHADLNFNSIFINIDKYEILVWQVSVVLMIITRTTTF